MEVLQAAVNVNASLAGAIGSITYRSRANGKPTWSELDALTRSAQERNRAAGLTGTLAYEDGRFFQCIEGPPEALEAVWDSIRGDPRHREIDVISMSIGSTRMFEGWDMRWLRKMERPASGDKASQGSSFLEPVAPAEALAQFVLRSDAEAVSAEVNRKQQHESLDALMDYVLEPVARALGDAWARDEIDQATLQMALSRLHRVVHERAQRGTVKMKTGRRLLSVASPGEPHMLGAVAAADLHFNAGWDVDLEFPATIAELLKVVAGTHYDRVDISTSDAIDRGEVRATAGELRRRIQGASRNREVEISFGGRAFWATEAKPYADRRVYRSSAAVFALA